jgi:hypothetical protein
LPSSSTKGPVVGPWPSTAVSMSRARRDWLAPPLATDGAAIGAAMSDSA